MLLLPTEEEATTEKVGEQTGGVLHLGEDQLVALRTGDLNWAVSESFTKRRRTQSSSESPFQSDERK